MTDKKTGIETRPCGCALDHDKLIIDPCPEHIAVILAKIAEDNNGKISFAKKDKYAG